MVFAANLLERSQTHRRRLRLPAGEVGALRAEVECGNDRSNADGFIHAWKDYLRDEHDAPSNGAISGPRNRSAATPATAPQSQ
jgi:hypothetical protein